MSVAMPSMASRLSLDFTKNVTLSHCHIGALLRDAPPTPDALQPPPAPPRGERTAGSRLKKDNNRNKKIEIIEEK